MYRMIKAATAVTAGSKISSKELRQSMGQQAYEQLYKDCTNLVDDEIVNQYGEVDVDYSAGDCTVEQVNSDGDIQITSQIYADFITESGREKHCYAEVQALWDGKTLLDEKVTHFSDDVEWE